MFDTAQLRETTTDRCEFRKKAKESLNIFSFIHSVVFLLYPEFIFRSIFTVKIKEMTKVFRCDRNQVYSSAQ